MWPTVLEDEDPIINLLGAGNEPQKVTLHTFAYGRFAPLSHAPEDCQGAINECSCRLYCFMQK
jgi:hypothetical protein